MRRDFGHDVESDSNDCKLLLRRCEEGGERLFSSRSCGMPSDESWCGDIVGDGLPLSHTSTTVPRALELEERVTCLRAGVTSATSAMSSTASAIAAATVIVIASAFVLSSALPWKV